MDNDYFSIDAILAENQVRAVSYPFTRAAHFISSPENTVHIQE